MPALTLELELHMSGFATFRTWRDIRLESVGAANAVIATTSADRLYLAASRGAASYVA
jgi:hypothetical protein